MMMSKYISMLRSYLMIIGWKCQDTVTGKTGVVGSAAFDLYGSMRVVMLDDIDEQGKLRGSEWFDVSRLERLSEKPLMELPDFVYGNVAEEKKGTAKKRCQSKS